MGSETFYKRHKEETTWEVGKIQGLLIEVYEGMRENGNTKSNPSQLLSVSIL